EDSPPGTPTSVSAAAPDLGPAFDAAVAGALAADAAARPSPTELAGQLAAGLQMSGVAGANPGCPAWPDPTLGGPGHVDMHAPTTVIATAKPVKSAAPIVEPMA